MKHCDSCNANIDTAEQTCPVCGEKLGDAASDETEAAEIAATMLVTGIL